MRDTQNTYGTVLDANAYFDARLHEQVWINSSAHNRFKALLAATRIIDALNFKGKKSEANQLLEFPRDGDTEVPVEIKVICYEIAHTLLARENFDLTGQEFNSVCDTYSRAQAPIEHLVNGVPNAEGWQRLKPFLRDNIIELSRNKQ